MMRDNETLIPSLREHRLAINRAIRPSGKLRPLLELGLVTDVDAGPLQGDRPVAFEFLQRPLHHLAHRTNHAGDLLMGDAHAGELGLLDDVVVMPDAAEEQPGDAGGDVSQR